MTPTERAERDGIGRDGQHFLPKGRHAVTLLDGPFKIHHNDEMSSAPRPRSSSKPRQTDTSAAQAGRQAATSSSTPGLSDPSMFLGDVVLPTKRPL